jgi:AcrR family transcriptional regulator
MPRKYRKRRRAELEEDTRRRITEALVALHGSIGPARTTVQAVAAAAGVQRATVYRHFPDEAAMFAACSAHWAQANPLPDPASWAAVADPGQRIRVALGDLYAFYSRTEQMLANILRDVSLVEALGSTLQPLRDYLASAVAVLASGEGWETPLTRAAIGHAIAFTTWRSLVREHGVSNDDAVALMTGMVDRAVAPA